MKVHHVAFFVGMFVVASNAVAANKDVKRSEAEQKAIAAIKKLGGKVTFAERKPGKPVTGVDLSFTKIIDADLVHLKGLTKLQTLSLINTKVTDAGLVHLKGMTNLQRLDLTDTKVTDAGLVHLKGLTKLQYLDLEGTKVTDAGLVHLKGLTNLQTLILTDTKATDAGVKKLQAALPKCDIVR